MAIARVISLDSGVYTILTSEGKTLNLKARGNLRKRTVGKDSTFNKSLNKHSKKLETKQIKLSPKVGDLVEYSLTDGTGFIDDILPRKNELIRPDISNVDQILLVFSAKRPDLSYFLLDLFISNLELNNIEPLIVISKIDLCTDDELNIIKQEMSYYESLGYKVFYSNSKVCAPKEIIPYLSDKITVLSGQTGAGKSTFINALIPGFKLETNDISDALNRGKHTTRRINLYSYFGGLIGDTPGFSKLQLFSTKEDLKDTFVEFRKCQCTFRDCMHQHNAKGCGVINAIGTTIKQRRYDSYIKMLDELRDNKYDN